MKILLVNPPFYRFQGFEQNYVPLSLLAVGSTFTREGHTVKIKNLEIDKNLSYKGYSNRISSFNNYLIGVNTNNEVWEELEKTICDFKPDQIGLTVLSVKIKSVLKIIEIAKKHNIKVFVGGPHIMVYPNSFEKNVEIISGEFESRVSKIRIKNLDELPMPNFDILLDTYSPNGYSHIVSSRGCPFKCKFCASNTVWNRNVTFKSAKRILKEMKLIKEKFNSDSFVFWDETFTLNKSRLVEFCTLYDLDAKWNCDTRADVLDEQTVQMMKNSGCQHISLGIESGRQHILDFIGKEEKLENFIHAAEMLNKFNIQWKAYCIVGFPEEDESDIFETIRFIKSLKPFRITLSFFTPYKGTSLYEYCLDKGLIDKLYDVSLYAHQSSHNYFTNKISKERYNEIKNIVSNEIDQYNIEAIKTWK